MREQRRPMRLNIGSASIIMLFSVLCLTVLAALSLLSANSQWRLAERSANSVSEYYAADLKASEIFGQIERGESVTDIEISTDTSPEGDTLYEYSVAINDRQSLLVRLESRVDGLAILAWKAIEAGDWTPDDSLGMWDGDISSLFE